MALKVSKAEVWSAAVDDRVGGMADRLEPLAGAGADFEFVLARRSRSTRERESSSSRR